MPAKGRDTNRLSYRDEFFLRRRSQDAESRVNGLQARLDRAEEVSAMIVAQLLSALEAKAIAERRADALDRRLHDVMHGRGGMVYRMEQGKLVGRTA